MDRIDKICSDIVELRIQGARNVARAALQAIDIAITTSTAKKYDEFLSEILTLADRLAGLRATEPMLVNLLSRTIDEVKKEKSVRSAKRKWREIYRTFEQRMAKALENVIGFGTNLIKDGSTILTHCHSSTVEKILTTAAKSKRLSVYCTETRPLFQGRITAKALSTVIPDVHLIVDSAVASIMHKVDMVLVGADMILAQGQLVNKIGTAGIAAIAYAHHVPFYVAAELWKFDESSRYGFIREIEQRPTSEIATEKEVGERTKILNPAFDFTGPRYITGYITELGVIPPQVISVYAREAWK